MWHAVKRRQVILFVGIGILGLVVVMGVVLLVSRPHTKVSMAQKSPVKSLTTGASRVNPQEVWVHQFSAQMDLNQKRLEALSKSVELLTEQSLKAQFVAPPETVATDLKNTLKGEELQSTVQGHNGFGFPQCLRRARGLPRVAYQNP